MGMGKDTWACHMGGILCYVLAYTLAGRSRWLHSSRLGSAASNGLDEMNDQIQF